MRQLVQIEDAIFELKEDSKGKVVAKRLNDDEIVEAHVLQDHVAKMLDNDFNKIANETLDEVRKSFKDSLRKAVMNVMGFTDHWGRWEIDNCNGRSSDVTQYIAQRVRNDITGAFNALLAEDIEKMVKPMREVLAKEYKETFAREVRSNMRAQASQAAKDFLSEVMKKQVTKVQREALQKAEKMFLAKQNIPVDPPDDD